MKQTKILCLQVIIAACHQGTNQKQYGAILRDLGDIAHLRHPKCHLELNTEPVLLREEAKRLGLALQVMIDAILSKAVRSYAKATTNVELHKQMDPRVAPGGKISRILKELLQIWLRAVPTQGIATSNNMEPMMLMNTSNVRDP